MSGPLPPPWGSQLPKDLEAAGLGQHKRRSRSAERSSARVVLILVAVLMGIGAIVMLLVLTGHL